MIDIEKLNTAIKLTQERCFDKAEIIYSELLSQFPEDCVLLSAVGLFYVSIQNYNKAKEYLEKACSINETLGTVSSLGVLEYEQGHFIEAAILFERAVNLGKTKDIYCKLLNCLFEVKNYKKAIKYAIEMYNLYQEDDDTVAFMAKALTYSGDMLEAEKLCVNYLKEHTNSAPVWTELGYLKELMYCDNKQACECFKLALENGDRWALYNIAVSHMKQGNYVEAEKYFKTLLTERPNNEDANVSLGMLYLKQRKFKDGYDLFFRRRYGRMVRDHKNFWKPGDSLEDEVLVISDQGFGDHIQFVRYLPKLLERVKNIYMVERKTLRNLFSKNYPQVKSIEPEEIDANMQLVRVTDLAYVLGIDFENIPFSEGYLKSEKMEIISEKPKVGICWQAGATGIRTMINRSIPINDIDMICNLENIQLYSLQFQNSDGIQKYPNMIDLAKEFTNFEDTAKAIMAMDIVITVDTSIAHLAGALGIKTFLLLPKASDWRWFSDTKVTPWYSSIEIFKQEDDINWEKPICDIVERLKAL